ncbi:MAG: A/G-specific adenine glycosylase [Fusicatenibacter sp.]|nr:A/G-specific adenine glycosylase [Fusicatenibacter sp.]
MLETITEPLLNWYEKDHRILPWRQKRDPYEIWVSEIMLQQTRVETVKPYYERFMKALPNVEALAFCPEEQLLKLWEGLGYYNRVRNMQKAAVLVTEEYQGILPADYDLLKSLPGIGSYTAGAVASIAYGIPVPAVDGNVFRVLARLQEDEEDITKQSHRTKVEQELAQIIPRETPGTFNQALMELGAVICVPNGEPKCTVCPLYKQCLAGQKGTWSEYPVKKKAKPRRIEQKTVFLLLDATHAVIRKRPKKGLLSGLYEFPNVPGTLDEKEALAVVTDLGFSPIRIKKLPDAKHIFSHVEWHMTGYAVKIEEPEPFSIPGLIFAEIAQTGEKYPIPAAFAVYAGYLNLKLGQEKYQEEM